MKFNIEIDGQMYSVDVENLQLRPVVAVVDGERFEVWPEETPSTGQTVQTAPQIAVPESAPAAAAPSPSSTSGKELTAPLPGVIVAVLAKPGDSVSRGQELLTLEAMKMKNAIKSHRDGVIDAVVVAVGDQVAHGQPLLTFKE